ncbi:MAG: DUF1573 domain-containing protein [Bacillota bacterium]|nr:DUF1573 domain-containing protein [Bacillota bacterium]HHU29766.1 DUF1573 domain-containing protein [Bacillota bacterium]
MEKTVIGQFQNKVSELLIRHRSILDSLTKFHESGSKVNRAIAKAVTSCGCMSVSASKQPYPPEIDLKEYQKYVDSHLKGHLCESCQEILKEEIGNHLFYLAAICHLLELDLAEILDEEYKRISALGFFHLS